MMSAKINTPLHLVNGNNRSVHHGRGSVGGEEALDSFNECMHMGFCVCVSF